MTSHIYMGIDPGIADAGYGVIGVSGGKQICLAYGSVGTPSGSPMDERLKHLNREIGALLDKFRPSYVAIENLYFQKNVKTAIAVAEARGVIRLCVADRGVPCAQFNPADVKIAVCGHGSAEKRQVQRMVQKLLSLDELPRPDDAADALALAITLAVTKKFETIG